MTTQAQRSSDKEVVQHQARKLVAAGHSYASVARELGVHWTTVRGYCRDKPTGSRSAASRSIARRNPANNEVAKTELAIQVYELRLQGLSVAQIAKQLRINPSSVRTRLQQEMDRRTAPLVEQLREMENDRLDRMVEQIYKVLKPNEGTELALKAIDRLVAVSRRRAALNGLDMPITVNLENHATKQDDETQQLLAEAHRRNRVIEGEMLDTTVAPADG